MNFPSTPTTGQEYSVGGKTWTWDGSAWKAVPVTLTGDSVPDLDASKITSGVFSTARMPAVSGDATSSAGSTSLTLASVNTDVGTFGDATTVPTFTVNAKGLVTAANAVAVTPAWSSITSKPTTLTGYGIEPDDVRVEISASKTTISSSPPASPTDGDTWVNEDEARRYTRVQGVWVEL